MLRIAVIIVTYNSLQYLSELIFSLKQVKTTSFSKVDWIFVDNNSSDETVSYVTRHFSDAVIIQTGENTGFAKGNNIGYEKAKELGCNYIYLLNADTIVDPLFLENALHTFMHDAQIACVQSKLCLYPEKELLNNKGNMTHYLGFGYCDHYKENSDTLLTDQEITYASGASMMIRCDILEKIGLFEDDFFMYAEDQDLCLRLQLLGYKIYLSANSIVYHKYSFSKSIKQYFFMERNRWLVILMNYRLATLILFLPMLIFFDVVIGVYSIFTGMWKDKVRVYSYFFSKKHIKDLWKRRVIRQGYRRVNDKEIIKRFSGVIDAGNISHPALTYIVNPIMNVYFSLCKLIIFW